MDEERIREICEEEFKKLNTRWGLPVVARHYHDGVDAPKILPTGINNVQTLSAQSGYALNSMTVQNYKPPVAVFPVPVLTTAFTKGTGPSGAMIFTTEPQVYFNINSTWYKVGASGGIVLA